jgi:aminoglycoside 3-N-acetyltransferase
MYTKKDIIDQLIKMGVPRDVPVLVHSSLRAVGEVEGRADGLIDALKAHICAEGGLLCIPTHTWANMGKLDVPTLDMLGST